MEQKHMCFVGMNAESEQDMAVFPEHFCLQAPSGFEK
jgi:hypothetical protein